MPIVPTIKENKASEPTLVQKWNSRIDEGRAVRKVWLDSFHVEDLDRYYEGFQRPDWVTDSADKFMVINLIFAAIKPHLDANYIQNPNFSVRPKRTYTYNPQELQMIDAQAKMRENLINYLMVENKTRIEGRKANLDAEVAFGVVKTFYQPHHKPHPFKGEPFKDSDGKPLLHPETGAEVNYPDNELVGEKFRVERRDPLNIIFDPWADSLETIKWVAEYVEMSLEEVKKNPLLKNTRGLTSALVRIEEKDRESERKKGDKNKSLTKPVSGGNASLPNSGDNKQFKEKVIGLWEIYDLEEDEIIVIAEGHLKELRQDPMPEGIEDHPYVFLKFIERRNSPYPIPDIWHLIGPQDEYNITRNQIVNHRKRYARKYEVTQNTVDDTELDKLEEPYDGMIIKTKTQGRALRAIEDPPLDSAVFFDLEWLRKDFRDISGDVSEGEISKIEKAGVAALLNSKMEGRKKGRQAVIQEFYQEIGRKVMLLVEAEMTMPMAISVVGQTGSQWTTIRPRDVQSINGEFNYEVSVQSLVPRNPEMERASFMAFMEFIGTHPIIAMNQILLKKAAEMFHLYDQTIIEEMIKVAQQIAQQQALQGGQPGKASPPKEGGNLSIVG